MPKNIVVVITFLGAFLMFLNEIDMIDENKTFCCTFS